MKLDKALVSSAISFVDSRFSEKKWVGAAAMYTDDGEILISTAPETVNESVSLCHETGAICEAYKLGKRITASVRVSYDDAGKIHILTPCGVCQERLMYWGEDVEVAVPQTDDSTRWQSKTLKDVQLATVSFFVLGIGG
jgi:cytidine deaminase